jgi:uncharacterized membrane protein
MTDAHSGHAQPSLADTPPYHRTEATAWAGWVIFAGILMMMLGIFDAIAGVVALFRNDYYLVGTNGLLVNVNWTTWGVVHLGLGLLVFFAGLGVLAGQTWGRVVGITLALLGAVVNLAFLAAYPLWNTILIALDVVVIYALAVHGREVTDA